MEISHVTEKYMWRLVMETQQGLILETTTKMQ
jgi:hypothetical protein